MIFVSGFTGKKWPVILWCLASLFLLIYSLFTQWMLPSEQLFWLNLQAIEDGRYAWVLSLILMAWPAWRNLKLGAWLFLLPLLSSILLSKPLIQSGKLHSTYFQKSNVDVSFNFKRWILGQSTNKIPQEFNSTNDQQLKSLIYLPNEKSKPAPLLIMLHGGGFYQGSPNWMHHWASSMSDLGIAVASVAYPLSPKSQFPSQLQEIKSTITELKGHLASQHVDTSSIFISGSSAGGTLALSTAIAYPELNIQGIIALYPITDFTKAFVSISDIRAIKMQYQGSSNDSIISPRFQLTDKMPPVLLMHGEKDNIIPVEQSRKFYQYMVSKKLNCEFIELPWATHNFEYPIYGPSGQLVENATFHFINRILKKQ
jgi:acetyl esterase/lipase